MCCTGYEMARYKDTQASHLYEKSMHTQCTINEQPLLAEASTILDRCLSHTYAHSAIFTAILSNSGIWPVMPGINTLLLWTGALGSLHALVTTLPIHGTNGFTWCPSHERHTANVVSLVFTPYKFGSTAGDRTPDLWLPGQRATTRPRLSN